MTGRLIRCQNSVRINVNLVQWRTHETFQWDVLLLPVILSYFSIVVKLVLVKCFDMLYIKQYVWVYEYVYIDFNFISCILCDICMTELFALCVLYFVKDDKIKMFNQSINQSLWRDVLSFPTSHESHARECSVLWEWKRHYSDVIMSAMAYQSMGKTWRWDEIFYKQLRHLWCIFQAFILHLTALKSSF